MRAMSFSFLWGLTKDYSLRDSLSDGLEGLLQRGKGGGQNRCNFGERVCAIKHTSWYKAIASHKKQIFQIINFLVLF